MIQRSVFLAILFSLQKQNTFGILLEAVHSACCRKKKVLLFDLDLKSVFFSFHLFFLTEAPRLRNHQTPLVIARWTL